MIDDTSLRFVDRQYKIPPLSYYCYKYINSHLDSIHSLGSLPFSLCEPILRSCSAEQLFTVETNSPHLLAENQEIWQTLCCRDFPRLNQPVRTGQDPQPGCWREQYFTCLREEEKRFEAIGSRLRIRREENDQEKKERQVIVTDKLFPSKRARLNSSKPKSLLAKAKADSLKVQRLFYNPSTLPSMPQSSKSIKPRPNPNITGPSPVKKPPPRSPLASPAKPSTPSNDRSANSQSITSLLSSSSSSSSPTSILTAPQSTKNSSGSSGSAAKKDPMAALFMPKHKAYSQRPSSNTPIAVPRK